MSDECQHKFQVIVGDDKTTYVCEKCDGFYFVTAAERREALDEEVARLYGLVGPDGRGRS